MTADSLPLRLLLATLAGWVNRHQQQVIDYLVEENRALREQLRGRRVRLSDDQRRRLAAKGQRLGRRVLRQVATIVTPDTIPRWYRRLIAQKWTWECRRQGASRAHEGDRDAHRADGDRESRVGLQPHPGGVEESRPPRREKHRRQGSEGQWDPAGARAAFIVAYLYAGALGRDCRCRLLHDGSVDCSGVGDLLHAVCAGSQEPAGGDRGLDAESRRGVHGAGRAAAHGRGRWVLGAPSRADL